MKSEVFQRKQSGSRVVFIRKRSAEKNKVMIDHWGWKEASDSSKDFPRTRAEEGENLPSSSPPSFQKEAV